MRPTQGHPTLSSSLPFTGGIRRIQDGLSLATAQGSTVQTGAVDAAAPRSPILSRRRSYPGTHTRSLPVPQYRSAPSLTYLSLPTSDGDYSRWPEPYTIHVPDSDDEDVGTPFRIDDEDANQYRQQVSAEEDARRAKKIRHWKLKVGTYLGERRGMVDLEDPTSVCTQIQACYPSPSLRTADKTRMIEKRHYILKEFPDGYALFEQRRKNSRKDRDTYLYGSGTVKCFRSPEEFLEHAEWLMNNMEGPCGCQYCDKDYVGRGSRKGISFTH